MSKENTTIEAIEASNTKDDEISLVDLFAVLWQRKWLIIITTFCAAVLAVVISILSLVLPPDKSFMPNKYTPRAQMLITEDSSGGAASMLGNLGGLASLAGVSVPGGSSNSALAGYLVNSNTIQDAFINKFNFIEEWEIEEDIFEDKNIEKTLKRYNYDYKSLMRELTTFIDYSELLEILDKCGIKKNEYLNPTYITFEKIRNYIINNGKTI